MIDVSHKITTLRVATAQAILKSAPETIRRVREGNVPKGNALETAKVAGIMAAKNTALMIPYCHPISIDHVGVEFILHEDHILIEATAKAVAKTGVEMEALTAAAAAALTLYDMLKMLDETMEIVGVKLVSKKGGKSDFRTAFSAPPRAAVLVMSDSVAAGRKEDASGRIIAERLRNEGLDVVDYKIVSDDPGEIEQALTAYADKDRLDLVVTTGGTGFSPRDNAPEAMARILEREIPGIPEAARAYGQERTPYSMLSRGKAGLRGHTLIVNLPGSKKGAAESLDALFPGVLHAFKMIRGGGHPEKEKAPR